MTLAEKWERELAYCRKRYAEVEREIKELPAGAPLHRAQNLRSVAQTAYENLQRAELKLAEAREKEKQCRNSST